MSYAEIKNNLTDAEAAASNNPQNPGAEPAVQEAEVKRSYDRSREGRIAAIDAKIEALQVKRQAILDAPEPTTKPKAAEIVVNAGETVTVEIGRGDTRRTVTGQVLAVFENKAGQKKIKVLAGEGVDTEVVEAFVAAVVPGEVGEVEEAGEEQDALTTAI